MSRLIFSRGRKIETRAAPASFACSFVRFCLFSSYSVTMCFIVFITLLFYFLCYEQGFEIDTDLSEQRKKHSEYTARDKPRHYIVGPDSYE